MKKHLGLILAISAISMAALGVAWFGEGNAPHPSDNSARSLVKINDLLYIARTNVGTVIVSNLSITSIGVTNLAGSTLNVAVTNLVGNVGITNGSLAVNVTNAALPVIGFTHVSTNTFTNASAAATVNYVGWAVTNTDAFRITSGSAILHSLTLISGTNRDYNIWVFPKVITAPTVGSAWAPTFADLQFATRLSTTNTTWALAGTNYVLTLSGIGLPLKNKDASQSVHLIGTYMDTKEGYNTDGYISVGLLQD